MILSPASVANPLGAWLFVVAAAAPFGFEALTFAVAAVLIAGIRPVPAGPQPGPPTTLRGEIAEGVRWLWRHRLVRTMAVSMGIGTIAFCAAFAVFVISCRQRLGLSDVEHLVRQVVASIRQRVVPDHLRGRVGSVYSLLDLGGAALGSLLGGLLASTWGITAPFWIAAGAMTAITVIAWRPLRDATA